MNLELPRPDLLVSSDHRDLAKVRWRTVSGNPLLVEEHTRHHRRLTFLSALSVQDAGFLSQAEFPNILLELLLDQPFDGAFAKSVPIAAADIQASADTLSSSVPVQSLKRWLALLTALLFALERLLSEASSGPATEVSLFRWPRKNSPVT